MHSQENSSIQPLRILAIDDHSDNRLLLTHQPTRLGHVSRVTIFKGETTLGAMVDLNALQPLTQHDPSLLYDLLRIARDENMHDSELARSSFQQSEWKALARCLHRLDSASAIIGASKISQLCDELEKYCEGVPVVDEVGARLKIVLQAIEELNQAIGQYLSETYLA